MPVTEDQSLKSGSLTMSESEVLSRRKALSLGTLAALFSLSACATPGAVRRQERREGRRVRRQVRRTRRRLRRQDRRNY